jgi:hypothetical protein
MIQSVIGYCKKESKFKRWKVFTMKIFIILKEENMPETPQINNLERENESEIEETPVFAVENQEIQTSENENSEQEQHQPSALKFVSRESLVKESK